MSGISLTTSIHKEEVPLAKRQRQCQCEGTVRPPDTKAVPTTPSSNVAATTTVAPINLDDIAELLMVNMQSNDSKVVYRAFEEIAMGCYCDKKDHELAIQYGAIGIILSTMKKLHNHDGIQKMAHEIFSDFLEEFPRKTAGLFIKLGGVEAILSAMNTHHLHNMDEYGTLFNGINALNALFKALKEDQQQSSQQQKQVLLVVVAKRFVEEMNGISTLMNALKRRRDVDILSCYDDDIRYTQGCIHLLWSLCYELYQEGSKKMLRKWEGSAALVAQAIEDYRDDEYDDDDNKDIQKKGMQLLCLILARH